MISILRNIREIIIRGIFLVLIFPGTTLAFDDDFGAAKKIETKYFITYYTPQLDIYSLLEQLNITSADKLLAGKSINQEDSLEKEFALSVDALFTRISDILDMHLYSFSSTIKICRDVEQLKRLYNRIFDKELKGLAFYVYDLNTIYISAENFKSEILGHEIAHALISHYFVVLPSVKIQEVLAGYVEYQLRKSNP